MEAFLIKYTRTGHDYHWPEETDSVKGDWSDVLARVIELESSTDENVSVLEVTKL